MNFSDPFGLCPDPAKPECESVTQQVAAALDATLDGVVDAMAAFGNRGALAVERAGKWFAQEAATQVAIGAFTGGTGTIATGYEPRLPRLAARGKSRPRAA